MVGECEGVASGAAASAETAIVVIGVFVEGEFVIDEEIISAGLS